MKRTAKIFALLLSLCLLAALFVVIGSANSAASDKTWLVGSEGYDDFAAAVNAADGKKTIKLNKDITIAADSDKGFRLNKSARVDLNGHSITDLRGGGDSMFTIWQANLTFELVGEGRLVGTNQAIYSTTGSTVYIEGKGSGISIEMNDAMSKSTVLFTVNNANLVTVKGRLNITPAKDTASGGWVAFKVGVGSTATDVDRETARRLVFDGAKVTINPPLAAETNAISYGYSGYLIYAQEDSVVEVKNNSYIDIKHGNFYSSSGYNNVTTTETFDYVNATATSYTPSPNVDYSPKAWVDIDDSEVYAYEGNVVKYYNYGSAGVLFTLGKSRTLVEIDNSSIGGAARAMGATYGYTAWTDSTMQNKVPKKPDSTDGLYFTALVTTSQFLFNNVNYYGDPNGCYGSPWMFCSGANVNWNGGYLYNRYPVYTNVKTITDTDGKIVDLASFRAACVEAGLDPNVDYYFDVKTENNVKIYTIKTRINKYYSSLTGDCLAYSEFTKNDDGTYKLAGENDTVDHWIGVKFENVYFAGSSLQEKTYNGASSDNYWVRPSYYTIVGNAYNNVQYLTEGGLKGSVTAPLAYLSTDVKTSEVNYAYANVYNPTSSSDGYFDPPLEQVPRTNGLLTKVAAVDGNNGYVKLSPKAGATNSDKPYLGIKTHVEYLSTGSYKVDGSITPGSAGNYTSRYRYIVQEFDVATESGTYYPGAFQFVIRAAVSQSYSTSTATSNIQGSVVPISIASDGTVSYSEKNYNSLAYSGKTFKLSTESLDWTRLTFIYDLPGTYTNATDKTIWTAYVGDNTDLVAQPNGKYLAPDGFEYEYSASLGYYNMKNGDVIPAAADGKEHVPAFISDTEGVIYTYSNNYTYKSADGKTITIAKNLTSSVQYSVTYKMDITNGKIYTYTVNGGTAAYLDSEGNAYTGSESNFVSAKICRANAASTVFVRGIYHRPIVRKMALTDMNVHVYINGEWYVSFKTIAATAVDTESLNQILIDQLRYNVSDNTVGGDFCADNFVVKYYMHDSDYSEIKNAVDNYRNDLVSSEFGKAPNNNTDYGAPVGKVDGKEYYSVEKLLAAVKDNSYVESYVDVDRTLIADKNVIWSYKAGTKAPKFISSEYSVYDNGSVISVCRAYTDEIFKVNLYSENLGINEEIVNAAYGTYANVPEQFKPEFFEKTLVESQSKVFGISDWTTDETLTNVNTHITSDATLYAITSESDPAIIEWYDQDGKLLLSEMSVYGKNVFAKDTEALRLAASRKLSNGMYDYAFASWDKDITTTAIEESGKTYKFTATVKGVLPEDGVKGIKLNVSIYMDFELNIYIPSNVEGVSDIAVYSDEALTKLLGSRPVEDLTVGGVPHAKFYVNYGTADVDIDTYYVTYNVGGSQIVYPITYGIPYYASAIMQKSDDEVGVKAKTLVMNMVNYASKVMAHGGVDASSEGGRIYTALLETFGVNSEYDYLSVYENMNAEMFTDKTGTIYKTQIEVLNYKVRLSGVIKSAGFYFSTESPAFVFEYDDAVIQHIEGIKAPNSSGFYSHNSAGVFMYFGYTGEATNPIMHLAYEGGIENGTRVNAFGKNGTVKTFSDSEGNKYTLDLETGKYYAVEGGAEYTGDAELTRDVSYYAYCSSYRYNETKPDGYHYVYNLLNPVSITVSVGNTDPETGAFTEVTSIAGGSYSYAAYVLSLIESNNTEYLDLAYSLYAYASVAKDCKAN